MEEFIIIKFENKYLLCSESVNNGDKIIFLNQNDEFLSGIVNVVEGYNIENKIRITCNNVSKDDSINYVYYIDKNRCYYPIIEMLSNVNDNLSFKRITRDKINLKTICVHCNLDSRDLESCTLKNSNCKKEKKSFASIK